MEQENTQDKEYLLIPLSFLKEEQNLSPLEFSVLIHFAAFANKNGITFVPRTVVAELVGCNKHYIHKAIQVLKEKGFMKTLRKDENNRTIRHVSFIPTK